MKSGPSTRERVVFVWGASRKRPRCTFVARHSRASGDLARARSRLLLPPVSLVRARRDGDGAELPDLRLVVLQLFDVPRVLEQQHRLTPDVLDDVALKIRPAASTASQPPTTHRATAKGNGSRRLHPVLRQHARLHHLELQPARPPRGSGPASPRPWSTSPEPRPRPGAPARPSGTAYTFRCPSFSGTRRAPGRTWESAAAPYREPT